VSSKTKNPVWLIQAWSDVPLQTINDGPIAPRRLGQEALQGAPRGARDGLGQMQWFWLWEAVVFVRPAFSP
jgi:hypothetical protein